VMEGWYVDVLGRSRKWFSEMDGLSWCTVSPLLPCSAGNGLWIGARL
jgi:hypothetical protein